MKQISKAISQEKIATSQVFTAMEKNQQGFQEYTKALNQTTLVITGLLILVNEFNQIMVTEFQGKNKTGDKLAV